MSSNAFAPALLECVLNPLSTLDSELTEKTRTVSYVLFPSAWAVPGIWKAGKHLLTTLMLDGKSQEGRGPVDSPLAFTAISSTVSHLQ